ncbi:MAG TPA: EF-Tu/IF-2/RF-3 family GTPase [Methanocorpusculum sp.]|nr:elongation factor Tu [Candidatus Methanocorpusculum equi]MCQ2357465.1 elongation factor Tu [Methanocorpusculum sp.]HJJ33604.1 EF-Tu/IF-2/RF-3 family GTPase [Methanocorpusculum sp.]HJJ44298.1 EF-Tu/IF-2/RF-3 family GTPase [Methanocorpusculum sp.]HJJ59473.1 EF-Tu/IF-2/RF-3 family GTPase [Methanocorpusculum sp.]
MPNLTVAVLAPNGYARDLGKKGTSTDITFYNLKKGHDTVTLLEPTRYPDRLAPLFYVVSMAHEAIVVVSEITPMLAEWILMLDCAGVKNGYIILKNYIQPEQIAPLIKGTVLEAYKVMEEDFIGLSAELLAKAAAQPDPAPKDGAVGTVPIDHHFNVRGVGTVILGCTADGWIKKHDKMRVEPTAKTCQIRSVQKHDDDFDYAFAGDRVGCALKDIEADDLDRGYVLTNDPAVIHKTGLVCKASLVKYWPSELKEQMVVSLGHWMQFLSARITGVDNGADWHNPTLTIELETPMVFKAGDTAVIHYLDGGKLRIVGTIKLE